MKEGVETLCKKDISVSGNPPYLLLQKELSVSGCYIKHCSKGYLSLEAISLHVNKKNIDIWMFRCGAHIIMEKIN